MMMTIIISQYQLEVLLKKNYESYQIRGDKDKKLSIKQYLYMIMSGLADLINKKKNDRVECKIQLNMGINFISTDDTEKTRTFFCAQW